MVAANPLTSRRWTLKLFRATVINDIWPELTFFTLVATMVATVTKLRVNLGISSQMLTVLGTVLGLVISFRTSSAYERFNDGRKFWSNILLNSRNLAQLIWIHVPNERTKGTSGAIPSDEVLRSIIEKKSMINLVQAFSVSVKHFLRNERGVYYADLYPLISILPKYISENPAISPDHADSLPMWYASDKYEHKMHYSTTRDPKEGAKKLKKRKSFDPEKALPYVDPSINLRPARNPPKTTIFDFLPVLLPFKWMFKGIRNSFRSWQAKREVEENGEEEHYTLSGKKKQAPVVESNVPLEICLFLSSYINFLLKANMVHSAVATALCNQIFALQDAFTNLERVRNTPIPFAYQAHLRMSLWLYLFFLPFQVVGAFGYLTIPGTLFASFLLLGFLEIGQEIENPFGYDLNDLDIDGFCLAIQRELHEITAHVSPDPSAFLYLPVNQPFAPADRRNAEEILRDVNGDYAKPGPTGMESVRRTLLKSWKEVNEVTREVK